MNDVNASSDLPAEVIKEEPDEKKQLECAKLQLEIENLRKPFRRNPAHWISTATSFLAVAALLFQIRLSRQEFVLAETKSIRASIEQSKAEEESKRLKIDVAKLESEISAKHSQLQELARLVKSADNLLAQAQPSAKPELRAEIATLRETTKPNSEFWASVPELVEKANIRGTAQIQKTLYEANQQVLRYREELRTKELPELQYSQGNFVPDIAHSRITNQMAYAKPGYSQPVYYTRYEYELSQNEIHFYFWDAEQRIEFYRTSAASPDYGNDFKQAVRRSVEPQLKAELQRQ